MESQANVGLPLFSNYIGYSWLLLIPVIGGEAYVFWKRLAISIGRASAVSCIANIASTILGTVVVVGTGLFLNFVFDASELPNAEGEIAALIALIPCFYLSVGIEARVGSPLLKQLSREDIRAAFVLANRFSYTMLAIVPIGRFIKNMIVYGRIIW